MRKITILIFIILLIFISAGCDNSSEQSSKEEQQKKEQIADSPYYVKTETIVETITNEENKTVYTISFTYPIITSTKKESVTEELNTAFKKEAADFISKIKESKNITTAKETAKKAAAEKKEFYPHSSTVNYVLQFNQDNIISFLKAREDYTGGITHIYNSEGITYNMETGKKLELSEIFEATNLGLIKILSNGFKTEAAKDKEIFKNKTDFTEDDIIKNMENLNWYLSKEGIVFFFNPNTLIQGTNEILQFTYVYRGNKTMFKFPSENEVPTENSYQNGL